MRPVTVEGPESSSEPAAEPTPLESTGPAHAARPTRRGQAALAGVLALALVAAAAVVIPHLTEGDPAHRAAAATSPSTGSATSVSPTTSATSTPSSLEPSRSPSGRDDALPAAVARALLARRTAAVRTGNDAAFLADLDATDHEFVAAQQVLFRSLRALPLQDPSWQLLTDPVARPDLESIWNLPVVDIGVAVRYRLAGFDEHAVAREQTFTLVRRDGRWRVADDPRAPGERPVGTVLDPWDEGPIDVVRRTHVLVVGTPGQRGRLAGLADTAEAAMNDVAQMWSSGWNRRAVLYAPEGKASRQSYFDGGPLRVEDVEAVELPVEDRLADWPQGSDPHRAGTRVIMNPGSLLLTSSRLPAILRHEFTHVATAGETVVGSARWLVEGAAEYTAHRTDPYHRPIGLAVFADVAKGRGITSLPAGTAFYRHSDNYDRVWLLFWYISQHWNQTKIKALYARLGPDGATTKAQTDRDLKAVLGVTQRELLAGFNSWARTHIRPA
jgi:hypothetical protein